MTELTSKKLQKLLKDEKTVMIEFWGSWCPPCQQMSKVIENLGESFNDKLKIAKVNIDKNPEVSKMYNIIGVPSYIFFQNGEIIYRDVGAKSEKQLKNIIEKVV